MKYYTYLEKEQNRKRQNDVMQRIQDATRKFASSNAKDRANKVLDIQRLSADLLQLHATGKDMSRKSW